MQNQMDRCTRRREKIHLYHCDHVALPLALISKEGATEWCAEYDEWGNLLNEVMNPHQLQQPSACRGSSMMRSPACITTATAIMTRRRGDISLRRSDWAEKGDGILSVSVESDLKYRSIRIRTLNALNLHSMGGTGERSGPDIWGIRSIINIFVSQMVKGTILCGVQDQRGESKGDGLWGPGKASNDTKEAALLL